MYYDGTAQQQQQQFRWLSSVRENPTAAEAKLDDSSMSGEAFPIASRCLVVVGIVLLSSLDCATHRPSGQRSAPNYSLNKSEIEGPTSRSVWCGSKVYSAAARLMDIFFALLVDALLNQSCQQACGGTKLLMGISVQNGVWCSEVQF